MVLLMPGQKQAGDLGDSEMKKLFLSVIIFIVFWTVPLFGATVKYIRSGAAGTGSGDDWTNAYASFAAAGAYARDCTYYVAGGLYSENVTVSTAESSTLWVKFKKANASDNSGVAGWDASYATDQAVITGKFIVTTVGYVEVEGVTGSGNSGHGIKFYVSGTYTYGVIDFRNSPAVSLHLHHVEIEGPGYEYGSAGVDGIYWNGTGKDFQVSYCYIHEIPRNGVLIGGVAGTSFTTAGEQGVLFENNYVTRTGGVGIAYPALHGQAIQVGYNSANAYTIFRNNTFVNTRGSANIAFLGGASASHTYSQIYNNLFYITDTTTTYDASPGTIWTNNAGGAVTDHIYIYNNTVFNFSDLYGRFYITSSADVTDVIVRNNLWVNSTLPTGYLGSATTISENGFYNNTGGGTATETASPFTDSANWDFTLKVTSNAATSGADLSAVFTTDILGITRSNWSIGAYEYATDETAPNLNTITIGSNGTTWTFVYDSAVHAASTADLCGNDDWDVAMTTAGAVTLAYSSGNNSNTIVCTGNVTVKSGDTVANGGVDYTQPGTGAGVLDTSDNELASFTNKAVANNSTQEDATGYDLTITVAGTGSGTVLSDPAGISGACASPCAFQFTTGTVVVTGASPNDGSYFQGWSGTGGCSGVSTCSLTLDAAKAATATFTLIPPSRVGGTFSGGTMQ